MRSSLGIALAAVSSGLRRRRRDAASGESAAGAAGAWGFYLRYRGSESVRGILPAWAADQYMLGRGSTVWPALDEALWKGYLRGPFCDRFNPCNAAYVKGMRALLTRLSYIRR
jgi:hypothetical protein